MENNTNNVNDKGKIMVLISIICAVSILLVAFVFVTVIDLTHKGTQSKLSTTTRRTVETQVTTEGVQTTEEIPTTEGVTNPPTTNTTTTVKKTTTTKKTTKPASTVVTKPSTPDEGTVIPSHSYEIAYDSTTYPDAIDSWEWEIVNLINQERKKNGLNEVHVARELRNMAEEAAYMYYASGSSAIKPYLEGYSYLYMHSNYDIDARSLFESTMNSTKITTNPDIKYVGAGVLVKKQGIDTYYYVIVYE